MSPLRISSHYLTRSHLLSYTVKSRIALIPDYLTYAENSARVDKAAYQGARAMCQVCLLSLAIIGDLSRCWFVQFERGAHLLYPRCQYFNLLLLLGDFGCECVLLLGHRRFELVNCALLFCNFGLL